MQPFSYARPAVREAGLTVRVGTVTSTTAGGAGGGGGALGFVYAVTASRAFLGVKKSATMHTTFHQSQFAWGAKSAQDGGYDDDALDGCIAT